MKLKTLFNSKDALMKLNNASNLKANIAYRIGKLCIRFDEEMKLFSEQRDKLIVSNSDGKNDDGNDIVKDPDKIAKISEELEMLLNENISIEIPKINIDDLDDAGLTPSEITSIEYILNVNEAS